MASKHISHPWWRSNDPLNPPTSFHKSSIFCKKRLYTNVMKVNNQLFLILSVCLESLETRKVSLNNGTTSIVDRDAGHTDKLFIQLKSLNNSIALLLFCPTPTSKPILPLLWRSCYGKTFILILFGVKKPVCESTKSLQKTNFDFVWTSCVYI